VRRTTGRPLPAARRVGIKDIARALDVSIGTVDRALHDKPGINAATRARVLATAEALGYRPNLAARHLKSGTTISIAVHLPQELAQFWDSLEAGIREAGAALEPTLHVAFARYPRYGEGDAALFEAALADGVDGLIVAPGDPDALSPCIRRAFEHGVAVACVVTDAPDTERLTSVSADPLTVGGVAGELLARFLPSGGDVAFVTGWLRTQDHAEKLRGFDHSLNTLGCGLRLASVVEAHEDESAAYRQTSDLVSAHPGLKGIYVSTVNSLPVLSALEDAGRLGSVTVVTTDVFPALARWIRSGAVAATLYQRPITQGRLAVQALYRYLLDGTNPPSRIKVVPHVVMRSNLDLLLP
jgi:LacI family transcriptional regulator